MYQALYRKWRPRDFDDVVGQEHITKTLRNEAASGRFSHAYLFTGSRGTGKTSCSKILAKSVNCEHIVNGNPCNECALCKGIDDGSILDVVEIDAASNNGVDNIRELREEAYFLPSVAKYRVYILDECHMLSPGAVNALLKILEEPPEHVIFILATTEIHKVLPTILSRCQRFDFKRIKPRIIADRLEYIGKKEELSLSDDAAMLIACLSDGGMRDALSLLDLCTSYSSEITVDTVTEAAGLSGNTHLFKIADAILSGDPSQAITVLDELSENSVDFARLCEQCVGHFRNLMLMKTVKEPENFIQATPDEMDNLRIQTKKTSINRVLYSIDILQETTTKISRTAFKRTEFEMALIRLCDDKCGRNLEGVLERLEKLEKQVRSGVSAVQIEEQSDDSLLLADVNDVTKVKPITSVKAKDADNLQNVDTVKIQTEVRPFKEWAQVLSELKKLNGALYGAMVESQAFTSGDIVLIDCANVMFLNLLRTSVAAKESLRAAILSVTGKKYKLGPYNPEKYVVAKIEDPLAGMLKKASELNISVELN